MERTLTSEEKIKRAEEIYLRRKNGYTSRNVATVNVSEQKNYGLFKKMILQIAICLLIYFIFYLIQNSNYVFSEDVINKTKEILSYDINFSEIYNFFMQGMDNVNQGILPTNNEENTINNEINAIEGNNAIGGAELENVVMENIIANEEKEEPKKEVVITDDEYIKDTFSPIKPVEGIVSSEFGIRDVNNPIVSKNHTGIDIAANTGTEIKASIDGTVTISSSYGDYGKHIKITNNDVSTLYAHCSELFVKVGDTVKKGDKIACVGSTGKSTGPHLHFEIIRGETYINPRNILEF